MIGNVFICPQCLLSEFPEEKHLCEICKEYETNRKDHLQRHKKTCQKYFCEHCKHSFQNRIYFKSHVKMGEKMKKNRKIVIFHSCTGDKTIREEAK